MLQSLILPESLVLGGPQELKYMQYGSLETTRIPYRFNRFNAKYRFVKSSCANEIIRYATTSILKGASQHLPDGGYDVTIDLVSRDRITSPSQQAIKASGCVRGD